MVLFGDFARRANPDSTIDLICTKCFQTIAQGKNDMNVEDVLKKHKCEPLSEVHRRFGRVKKMSDL
jgi:hypothetical protein